MAELYTAHAPDALRLAYVLTGDGHAARDIVQDAFVRLFGKLVGAGIGGTAIVKAVAPNPSTRHPSSNGSPSTTSSTPVPVSVPDVSGLPESEAVKTLAAAGLVAEIRYDPGASKSGTVLSSDPPGGSAMSPTVAVRLVIAPHPLLPTPGPGHEQDVHPLSSLVEANHQAFVGLYRDDTGVPVVVFNRGADPSAWREQLDAVAGSQRYLTDVCPRTHGELHEVQDEIALRVWSPNADSISFGAFIDPATCSVRVESDQLSAADIQALVDRFGTAITVDTTPGSHPELLMSA